MVSAILKDKDGNVIQTLTLPPGNIPQIVKHENKIYLMREDHKGVEFVYREEVVHG